MSCSLAEARYDEIRSVVADLIEDWGISTYPFSIWELLRRMGIRVFRYSELPEQLRSEVMCCWPDAITCYPSDLNPTRTIILYNDFRERRRIRFTVAHELAHLILMRPGTGEKVYEDEADFFAGYLLAPAPLVLRDSKLDASVISDDYQVSYSCACNVRDRAAKRLAFGSLQRTEYELRILDSCTTRGGGGIAWC